MRYEMRMSRAVVVVVLFYDQRHPSLGTTYYYPSKITNVD